VFGSSAQWLPTPFQLLETILVVDDNPEVLSAVSVILRNAEFHILKATNGPEAVELAHGFTGTIDMLLSDWNMPEMSGPALGRVLKLLRPDIHVMLMSGDNSGSIMILNYGWAFLEKPFETNKLVSMVTDVLRTPSRAQAGGEEFDSRKDHEPPLSGAQKPKKPPIT